MSATNDLLIDKIRLELQYKKETGMEKPDLGYLGERGADYVQWLEEKVTEYFVDKQEIPSMFMP